MRDPFATPDRLMRTAIEARSFPSAVLLVTAEGQIVFYRAYGRAGLDSVFDLASLTKPLATTAVLMRLCESSSLSPAAPISQLMPNLAPLPLGRLRLWQLLSHSSGLTAWRPYYEQLGQLAPNRARRALWRRLAAEPIERIPGVTSVYSDLGFMLLGRGIERYVGQRLDRVAYRSVFGPLGLSRMGFAPGPERAMSCVPTERLAAGGRLVGQVHDDNCRAVGGICGHAGLFGSAYDVHLLARELVAAYRGRRSLFMPSVVRRFFDASPVSGSSWALGWDTPRNAARPACGRRFSAYSVGHLGFTGTSLWIDLEHDISVVLLTNRVYFGREPNPMKRFRPRLHDAVMEALKRRKSLQRPCRAR